MMDPPDYMAIHTRRWSSSLTLPVFGIVVHDNQVQSEDFKILQLCSTVIVANCLWSTVITSLFCSQFSFVLCYWISCFFSSHIFCMYFLFQFPAADPAMNLVRGQPNVDAALNTQPDTVQQELRKPTIGGRKPQAKRSGVWRLLVYLLITLWSPPPSIAFPFQCSCCYFCWALIKSWII